MKLRNGLFIVVGFALLGLGLIGVILPILPTTPFVLISLYLLQKGSPKLQTKMRESKLISKVLNTNYSFNQRMVILVLVLSVLIAITVTTSSLTLKIILTILMVLKSYVFLFVLEQRKENEISLSSGNKDKR